MEYSDIIESTHKRFCHDATKETSQRYDDHSATSIITQHSSCSMLSSFIYDIFC